MGWLDNNAPQGEVFGTCEGCLKLRHLTTHGGWVGKVKRWYSLCARCHSTMHPDLDAPYYPDIISATKANAK